MYTPFENSTTRIAIVVNLVYFCLTAKKPTVITEQETSRIVGGFDTKGPLPYQLALETRDDFYIYGCGGILISSRFGITADYCIDDTKDLKYAQVFAGAYKWNDFPYEEVQSFL